MLNTSNNGTPAGALYHLMVTKPAPSMCLTKILFRAHTYAQAVEFAKQEWRRTRRAVMLHSGELELDPHYLYAIDSAGNAVNRNGNTGVPEREAAC